MGRITSTSKFQLATERAKKSPPVVKEKETKEGNHSRGSGVRRVSIDRQVLSDYRVLNFDVQHPARAAYKMLRTRVMRRMDSNHWKTLAITSLSQGEGKTLTAINLAISIAGQRDQSVILIDLDLRSPSVYRYLGLDASPGIRNWFNGSVDLRDILVCPGVDRLHVLPNNVVFDDSSEIIQSGSMRGLIEQLNSEYSPSVIIFDLPPLLEADDALAFSPNVDATLLVISQGQTVRGRLAQAKEMLEDTTLIGTVLNKSDEATASYY